MTNYERIKNMTKDELQQFLCQISSCPTCPFASIKCKIDEWLDKETTAFRKGGNDETLDI